jgi:hypothetical protein
MEPLVEAEILQLESALGVSLLDLQHALDVSAEKELGEGVAGEPGPGRGKHLVLYRSTMAPALAFFVVDDEPLVPQGQLTDAWRNTAAMITCDSRISDSNPTQSCLRAVRNRTVTNSLQGKW